MRGRNAVNKRKEAKKAAEATVGVSERHVLFKNISENLRG